MVFKIKTYYKLELQSEETRKLKGRTEKEIERDEKSENVPRLEKIQAVLMHCSSYQQS